MWHSFIYACIVVLTNSSWQGFVDGSRRSGGPRKPSGPSARVLCGCPETNCQAGLSAALQRGAEYIPPTALAEGFWGYNPSFSLALENLKSWWQCPTRGLLALWRWDRGWTEGTKRWCGLGWPLCTSTGSAKISVYQWEYSVLPPVI